MAVLKREIERAGAYLDNGYSRHLGGPWYLTRSPDSGRLYFAKDNGRGTTEIPVDEVPESVLRRIRERAS